MKNKEPLLEKLCCGCMLCEAVCPKKAIEPTYDKEGFLIPNVREDQCVHCDICKMHCPALNLFKQDDVVNQLAYAARCKDDVLRKNSSSGGIFSLLAEWIISQNGVVFGAAFDDDFNVVHKSASAADSIGMFRGSKYAQSATSGIYTEIEQHLRDGRTVLFSGTPCQCIAVKEYLKAARCDDEKLLLVDLICHGVPSNALWKAYLAYRKKEHHSDADITAASFRDKEDGWRKFKLSILFSDGERYAMSSDDYYLKSFFWNYSLRNSCYECTAKQSGSCADITLADCWGIENMDTSLDDDKGTSLIILNTEKGRKMMTRIVHKMECAEIPNQIFHQYNRAHAESVRRPMERERFILNILRYGWGFSTAYFDMSFSARAKRLFLKKTKRL